MDFGRIREAPIGFVEDVEGDQNQDHAVQQRGKNLDSVETEGLLGSRAPCREPARRQAEAECGDIRQHVARIGKKRQGIGVERSDKLGDEKCGRDNQGRLQRVLRVSVPMRFHERYIITFGVGRLWARGEFYGCGIAVPGPRESCKGDLEHSRKPRENGGIRSGAGLTERVQ